MKINKRGFTLIEILVVVLIIGILAAIALPQYRTSIMKAKFAQYETLVKDITGSMRRMALVKDMDWGYTFQELDIDLPGIKSTTPVTTGWGSGEVATFDWGYCYMLKPILNNSDGDVFCGNYDCWGYVQTIQLGSGEITFSPYCVHNKADERSKKFCESFGPSSNYGVLVGPDGGEGCAASQCAINS